MAPTETEPAILAGQPVRTLRVEVIEGPDRGKAAEAASDRLTIGTAEANTLRLSDDTVSRYHLDLIRKGDRVELIDHDSTNGTWVGGAAVLRAFVLPGATLRVGRNVLRVVDGEAVTVELLDGDRIGPLFGRSVAMRELMAKVRRCAESNASLLLTGETGSGKEVVARAVHEASPRAGGPFETVDCGSMVEQLMVSELFGHEKGAFTGAERQHIGAFERANGGTLFLDEIGELPPNLQTALLGALERRAFRRLGGSERVQVDVRLVCATHRDLRAAVNTGRFRQDLYYRIAVVTLEIPPLRERSEDIPLLAELFLRAAGSSLPLERVFSPQSLAELKAQDWPGNVRELRNVVEATLAMGEPPALGRAGARPAGEGVGDGASIPVQPLLGLPYADARAQVIDRFEDVYLRALLERNADSIVAAAREAKMDRTYLSRLLRKRRVRPRRAFPDAGAAESDE